MTRHYAVTSASSSHDPVVRAVTGLTGAVVGLTFLFGFGNVWALALRLGVFPWVAPLVAPAVDLSILGLLLAIRRLVIQGAESSVIAPARRLLVFSSPMTLGLNVAEPLITHHYGRAEFDAVGPLLLIGWAEVAPGGLEALQRTDPARPQGLLPTESRVDETNVDKDRPRTAQQATKALEAPAVVRVAQGHDDLITRAREADAPHWRQHRRPISAESLRKELKVGATRSRELVTQLRGAVDRPGHGM
ncbi:DUF2637 domain-containing protein [Embleya sp. NPDC001921]